MTSLANAATVLTVMILYVYISHDNRNWSSERVQMLPEESLPDGQAKSVRPTGAARALTEIRHMIATGELLPGEKLHQAAVAAKLQLSRIPVREALSTLQAEGLLDYTPNTGFTVARFTSDDLLEVYLMRRVLETELLRSIDLGKVDVEELERINAKYAALDPRTSPEESAQANFDFHFRLFEYSPLRLVREEVLQLWRRTTFYRSMWLLEEEASDNHVHKSHHVDILNAIRAQDVDQLIAGHNEHRAATERIVSKRVPPRRGPRLALPLGTS